MNKSQKVSSALKFSISAQVGMIATQFSYSYLTARIFMPSVFGEFVLLLSLQGFLMLVSSTGVPSYLLKLPQLDRNTLRGLRVRALKAGALASIFFILAAPFWTGLFRIDSHLGLVPLLGLSLAITPICTMELYLLRRQGKFALDAIVSFGSVLTSSLIGYLLAQSSHQPFSLAIVSVLTPLQAGLMSRILRDDMPESQVSAEKKNLGTEFVRRLTLQNLAFLFLNQIPFWIVGLVSGAASVGFLTRATALTQLPAANLADAINKPLQPMWRHIEDKQRYGKGVLDAMIISSSISFFVFGLAFLVGPSFSILWLGDGWIQVTELVRPLAIFAAFYVPYAVATNSLEMSGQFGVVRESQILMFFSLLIGSGAYAYFESVVVLTYFAALGQIGGVLLVAARLSSIQRSRNRFITFMGLNLAFASSIFGATFIIVSVVNLADYQYILYCLLVSVILQVIFFRYSAGAKVMREREIRLPLELTSERWGTKR